MRKRTLFALLVTVLAVFTLAVSADAITVDQPLLLRDGKIYGYYYNTEPLEIQGITYENGKWIIKDLDLTVCYDSSNVIDVEYKLKNSYPAIMLAEDAPLVIEGNNTITLKLGENAETVLNELLKNDFEKYQEIYNNFYPSVIAAGVQQRERIDASGVYDYSICYPLNIQGREVDGVKPTLKLVNNVLAPEYNPPASIRSYNYSHKLGGFDNITAAASSITVDGVSLETNAPMFCYGDITVQNCPKFEILYDEITATESHNGYLFMINYIVATGKLTIDNCPGFKLGLIDKTLYGGGGIGSLGGIEITNCENFSILPNSRDVIGIQTTGNVVIDNCPGFKIKDVNDAILLEESKSVEDRSVTINNCEGFELDARGGNGISIGETYLADKEFCKSAVVTITNSANFKISAYSRGISMMLTSSRNCKKRVTIDNCPGFTMAGYEDEDIIYPCLEGAIAINEADGVTNATVEIKNSENFKLYGNISVNNTITIDNCADFLIDMKNLEKYSQSAINSGKDVKITNCPNFKINAPDRVGIGIYANGNVFIENCSNFKISALGDHAEGIYANGNVQIKNCPSFEISALSDWGKGIDIVPDGSLLIEGCPNFKINADTDAIYVSASARAYGEDSKPVDYKPTKTQSVKIKDSEGFEISSEYSWGIQVFMPTWSNNASVEIENCKNFKINALSYGIFVQADVSGANNSISIKGSEGFEISVSSDDWYTMNGICISAGRNAENCNNSIAIENSEGFKVYSEKGDGININSYASSSNNSVTIKDSAKFAITTNESEGIAIASGRPDISISSADEEIAVYANEDESETDVYGDNTVTIENCPDFVIKSVYKNEKGIHGGTNIFINYNSDAAEDTVCGKASVRIAGSDNFVLEGARNIQVYANIYAGNGSVQIDNCKNFSATSHADEGITVCGSYNVNASSGYVEALGDLYYYIPEGEEPYDWPETAVVAYKISADETALITHTGETTADREVGVIYIEDGDIVGRQFTYKENADDESENFKMAPKVIYSLPEPEPEPEPEKKFTLPYLIEIRFDTNGGTKLRSALSTPGYSLGLARYIPEKSGYTFTGWYEDKELTKPIKRIVAFENTTIYAGWTTAD